MNLLPHELANEIFMSGSFAAHLVVEGNSDYALFRQHVKDRSALNIVPAHGSPRVLACKSAVDFVKASTSKYATWKVHFFLDLDYRLVLGTLPTSTDLSTTDHRDIECHMVDSPAFETVFNEVVCPRKAASNGLDAASFKEALVVAAKRIGSVRFMSQKDDRGYDFKGLNSSKFFDCKTLVLSDAKFATHLAGKNQPKSISIAQVRSDLISVAQEPYFTHSYLLCSGHDLVQLMSEAVDGFWKPKGYPGDLGRGTLEAMLRVAFRDFFRSLACYRRVFDWLVANTGRTDLISAPT